MALPVRKQWRWTGTKKNPGKNIYLFNEKGDVILCAVDSEPNVKYAEIIANAEVVLEERTDMFEQLVCIQCSCDGNGCKACEGTGIHPIVLKLLKGVSTCRNPRFKFLVDTVYVLSSEAAPKTPSSNTTPTTVITSG